MTRATMRCAHASSMRHARCAPYQVEALVTELVKIVDEGLGHKSIVFSQVCFVFLTSAHVRPDDMTMLLFRIGAFGSL